MSEKVIPASTRLAAKRGFVRTATQSLASAIPITAIAIPTTGDALLGVGLGVAGAVVTALLAGAASALSIISGGVPEAYQAPGTIDLAEDAGEEDVFVEGITAHE